MKNSSCLTNLKYFLDEITRRLNESKHAEVFCLHLRKAFD